MAEQGYITPARQATRSRRPARPGARTRPPPRLRRGQRRPLRLRLRAEVPDADPRHHASTRSRPAATIRTSSTPSSSGPATPRCWTRLHWRTTGPHVLRRRAGHRAPARPERQPDLRLRPSTTRRRSRQPQRRPPRRGVHVQGVRGRRCAGPRLLDPVHADRAEPLLSRVYREDGGPYTVGTPAATVDPGPDDGAYQSSNTYFVALEDALGSVEDRCDGRGAWGCSSSAADLAQTIIDENAVIHPRAGRDQPAGRWRAPTRRWRPRDAVRRPPVTRCSTGAASPRPRGRRAGREGDQCTPEAIPAGVANTLNQMLRKDVEPGNPGQTAPAAYVRGHQIAGKTGTAQGNVLGGLRRLHAGDHCRRHGVQPEGEPERGRFRRRQGRHLWRAAVAPILEGAGERGVPARRPEGRQRQHQAGPGLPGGEPVPRRAQCGRLRTSTVRVDGVKQDGGLQARGPRGGAGRCPGSS